MLKVFGWPTPLFHTDQRLSIQANQVIFQNQDFVSLGNWLAN
jgi:hypothetical protein